MFEIELHEVMDGVKLGEYVFGDDKYPEISCDLMLELFGSVLIDVFDDTNRKIISLILLIRQYAENFQ